MGGLGPTGVKAKPLASLGLDIQSFNRNYQSPYAESYYGDEGYEPYHPGSLYPDYPAYPPYPYPNNRPRTPYGSDLYRYDALDIGIGALSLTPFLL